MAYDYAIKIPGLKPIMPNGAMYMMVILEFYLSIFRDFSIYDIRFVKNILIYIYKKKKIAKIMKQNTFAKS